MLKSDIMCFSSILLQELVLTSVNLFSPEVPILRVR